VAIHWPNRQSQRTGSDRGRKLRAPPASSAGRNVSIDLFVPEDLPELARNVGLALAGGAVALPAIAARINEAFSDYASATAIQTGDSSAGQRRDRSAGVAAGCADLMLSLGHNLQDVGFGRAAFDAKESLNKGWPGDPTTPADGELQERLKRLFMVAVPDTYASTERLAGAPDLDAWWWNLLGRLRAALAVVSEIAEVAQRGWGAETARGGSGRDRGRRHLIGMLVGTFDQVFGSLPEAAPGSAGFKWFSAAIALAGRRAGDQLGLPEPAATAESQARIAALKAIEALARHIGPPPYKMATEGTAKVDHWLREALDPRGASRAGTTRQPASAPAPITGKVA
jgi:hypothetical protein